MKLRHFTSSKNPSGVVCNIERFLGNQKKEAERVGNSIERVK